MSHIHLGGRNCQAAPFGTSSSIGTSSLLLPHRHDYVPPPLCSPHLPAIVTFLHNVLQRKICFHFPKTLQIKLPILDFFQFLIALTHFMLKFSQFDRNESSF